MTVTYSVEARPATGLAEAQEVQDLAESLVTFGIVGFN